MMYSIKVSKINKLYTNLHMIQTQSRAGEHARVLANMSRSWRVWIRAGVG
jgi:hypothetical protein